LKLRPAADSALSVLDSHPQFNLPAIVFSVRHCFLHTNYRSIGARVFL
jgi:hypothetical protein